MADGRRVRDRTSFMKSFQKIPFSEIDLADRTFSVNFRPDLERLRASILEVGLIQPVLLRARARGFQIVSGFRRLTVARQLGWADIEARLVEERGQEDLGLFLFSLHENLTTRGLNVVETAIALEKLVDFLKGDSTYAVRAFLPLFSLETNEKILNTYLSLARLEDEVKEFVLREKVSRSNIRKLSALTPEDRAAALSLLASLKVGENTLRELLALLEETARREECTWKEISGRPEIQNVLSSPDLTPSQKTEKIKKALMDLRYPRMKKRERDFEKRKKELDLPPNLWLEHSPFFEENVLRMAFRFGTMEEYRASVSALAQLSEREEFEEMVRRME